MTKEFISALTKHRKELVEEYMKEEQSSTIDQELEIKKMQMEELDKFTFPNVIR